MKNIQRIIKPLTEKQKIIADKRLQKRKNNLYKEDYYSSVPNVISKSNYFLPTKNTDKYQIPYNLKSFKSLSVFSHKGISSNLKLGYTGYRGTMWDFKIFATILKELDINGKNLIIELPKKDLFSLLNLNIRDNFYTERLENTFLKFMSTIFKGEFRIDKDKKNTLFFKILNKFMISEDKKKALYALEFDDFILKTAVLDYFNNVDLNVLDLLGKNQSAIRLYTFLSTHQNEVQISLDELTQLFNPEAAYDKYFLKNFKKRAIEPLHDLEFLDKTKIGFDSKTRRIHFKPNSFNTNISRQKLVRRNTMSVLKRRDKRTIVNVKLKMKEKEIIQTTKDQVQNKVERLLKKSDIKELYEFWKTDLKLKTPAENTKSLLTALTNIDNAIKGTLYYNIKQYEKFNRSYTKEEIKRSFETFYVKLTDYDIEPADKSFLQTVKFQDFMKPNERFISKVSKPIFIQCLEPIQLIEKPFDEERLNDYVIAFAREKKRKLVDVTITDKKYLAKSLNQLKEVGFKFKKPPHTTVAVLQTVIRSIKKSKKLNIFEAKDLFFKSNPKNLLQSFEIFTKEHGFVNQI